MGTKEILVLDTDAKFISTISDIAKKLKHSMRHVKKNLEALKSLKSSNNTALIITLRKGAGIDGEKLLEKLKETNSKIPIIVVSKSETPFSAAEIMRKGAFYCMEKPVEVDHATMIITEAIANCKKPSGKATTLEEEGLGYDCIIGKHKSMRGIFEIIKTVGNSDVTVLIQGESGVGKELVAKAIHNASARSSREITVLNCGVLPENLLESELFGHVKGSFTGAVADRVGKFEVANNSTLFLDEVGEMPTHLQVKLLRFLQEREFEPVGGHKTIKSDVRVIAATNRDLRKEVDKGTFRLDLYYRLHVIPIYVPSLKHRGDDILLLADSFLKRLASKTGRKMFFSKEACKTLINYSWPGNVRELENLIQQIVVLCPNEEIQPEDLPISVQFDEELEELPEGDFNLPQKVAKLEKKWIENALRQSQWNRTQTAKALGMTRKVLFSKMKKNNILAPK